jgi:hypothetical protein
MVIKSERRQPDISGMPSPRVLQALRRALSRRDPRPSGVLPADVRVPATRSTSPTYVNLIAPLPAPAPRRPVEFEVTEQA